MRELIENERGFIRSVAMRLDPAERDKLLHDLTTARVESIAYDDSLLVLHLDGYQRPAEWGQHTYPQGYGRSGGGCSAACGRGPPALPTRVCSLLRRPFAAAELVDS